eukprot:TRINITY_DN4728_c0_g1_i1.p1 TRINITY_DN4728_c0_g1~~TRINITY_DN4728_c0_g1_i1.p1  ORF type:complete len:805 (-),score=91.02 TRINITY_DN4728_c0_g1_i1:529-2943(-)
MNFESRFQAQISKLHAHGSAVKLFDAVTAFTLLANADIDPTQRISVLANSAPTTKDFSDTSTTDDYLKAVSYSSIASVLRQCERSPASLSRSSALSSNAANAQRFSSSHSNTKTKLTPEQLADLKSLCQCRKCSKYGHWASDHKEDGSLKPGVPSYDAPKGKSCANKTLTFNMVRMCRLSGDPFFAPDFVGPLLDDGAPYSGLGNYELSLVQDFVVPDWNGQLDPLPASVANTPFWQYGNGDHSSEARPILGSIVLSLRTNLDNIVYIRHLVIQCSSQWVIGRNVTQHCNILHQGRNVLQLPSAESTADEISLVNHDMHCYTPHLSFTFRSHPMSNAHMTRLFCATATIGGTLDNHQWSKVKHIVDKVHKHVCGHATYTDIKTLLQRNQLWDDTIEKYLSRTLEECTSCTTTARPQPPRKVSISSMSRAFNEVVCVDHMFLDEVCVFHVMDAASRYSAGLIVPNTSMAIAISAFETVWISPLWIPDAVLFDPAFHNDLFTSYIQSLGIHPRPIPPRRHNKNILEFKHKVIRDIFESLKHASSSSTPTPLPLLIQQSLRICNDLYGNDVLSAYELAKGFTRPVVSTSTPTPVPAEMVEAHQSLVAKRKLTLILRSKATTEIPLSVGDMVQLFVKHQHQKRGHWSSAKPILSYDRASRTVTVPGAHGRKISAAIEDIRPAVSKDELAARIQDALDEMQSSVEIAIEDADDLASDTDSSTPNEDGVPPFEDDEDSPATSLVSATPTEATPPPSSLNSEPSNDTVSAAPSLTPPDPDYPSVGASIEIYWPLDKVYYPGTVTRFTARSN